MPVYDYVCAEGHIIESRRSSYDEAVIDCPVENCGVPAARVAGYDSQYLITETGAGNHRKVRDVPYDQKRYMLSIFQEACEEREYEHKKLEESVGRVLPHKNLWKEAKQKAHDTIIGRRAPEPRKYVKEAM